MRAWVDADGDGDLDRGEPYVTFESNFSDRLLDDSGSYDYEYPQHFKVLIQEGSTRVGRGGHDTELRLQLVTSVERTVHRLLGEPVVTTVERAVTDAPVGAAIIAGPSRAQPISCLNTSLTNAQTPHRPQRLRQRRTRRHHRALQSALRRCRPLGRATRPHPHPHR